MTRVLIPPFREIVISPGTVESPRASSYDERLLFLSGRWEKPGSEFRFRATVRVYRDGSASGVFYWQALRVYGRRANCFGTEWVDGSLRGKELKLAGHRVEGAVATDVYRIRLSSGEEAGTFGGTSRTHALNWCGRMHGTYVFRNRTA